MPSCTDHVTVALAVPFTVATKDSDPPLVTVAVSGLMATDTEDGVEGDEAEDVADVGGFPHPVDGNSRPSERANPIEDDRCTRNCDFIAKVLYIDGPAVVFEN